MDRAKTRQRVARTHARTHTRTHVRTHARTHARTHGGLLARFQSLVLLVLLSRPTRASRRRERTRARFFCIRGGSISPTWVPGGPRDQNRDRPRRRPPTYARPDGAVSPSRFSLLYRRKGREKRQEDRGEGARTPWEILESPQGPVASRSFRALDKRPVHTPDRRSVHACVHTRACVRGTTDSYGIVYIRARIDRAKYPL